jgi:membrane protein YqaA with SNARE-associated domain
MSVTSSANRSVPFVPKHWARWAFGWGLAEATFFFIVPDVLLTRLALQDYRRALFSCVITVIGALLGGALLWMISDYEVGPRILRGFTYLPGINRDHIASSGQSVLQHGAGALFSGMLRGEPYKVFAVHSGVQEVSFSMFLLVSAIARLARFVSTATLAAAIGRLFKNQPPRLLLQCHTLAWLLFYLTYFLAMA